MSKKCKICGKECNERGFSRHVQSHGINMEAYEQMENVNIETEDDKIIEDNKPIEISYESEDDKTKVDTENIPETTEENEVEEENNESTSEDISVNENNIDNEDIPNEDNTSDEDSSENEINEEVYQPNGIVRIQDFSLIDTKKLNAYAYFDNDGTEIKKQIVGVGLFNTENESVPCSLILTEMGTLIPPFLIPGFKYVHTEEDLIEQTETKETEKEQITDDNNDATSNNSTFIEPTDPYETPIIEKIEDEQDALLSLRKELYESLNNNEAHNDEYINKQIRPNKQISKQKRYWFGRKKNTIEPELQKLSIENESQKLETAKLKDKALDKELALKLLEYKKTLSEN